MVAPEKRWAKRKTIPGSFVRASSGSSSKRSPRRYLAGDEIAAETTIREAMDARLTAAEIDGGIIAPALWLLGALCELGEGSVADEHLATEISSVLALQREADRVAQSRRGNRVLLATPPGRSATSSRCGWRATS